jgi:hypothetical protein
MINNSCYHMRNSQPSYYNCELRCYPVNDFFDFDDNCLKNNENYQKNYKKPLNNSFPENRCNNCAIFLIGFLFGNCL